MLKTKAIQTSPAKTIGATTAVCLPRMNQFLVTLKATIHLNRLSTSTQTTASEIEEIYIQLLSDRK